MRRSLSFWRLDILKAKFVQNYKRRKLDHKIADRIITEYIGYVQKHRDTELPPQKNQHYE